MTGCTTGTIGAENSKLRLTRHGRRRPARYGSPEDREPVQYRLLVLLRISGARYHVAYPAQTHAAGRFGRRRRSIG